MDYREELYHYGVQGMKWGIRRYQNPDGSLTTEGKKRAKQEYRADNREASKKGYNATVLAKASKIASNKSAKAEVKYNKALEKDPEQLNKNTKRLYNNYIDRAKAAKDLSVASIKATKSAEDHCKQLVEKYGKEAVSTIKYKDLKNSNALREKTGKSNTRIINEATKQDNLSRWATVGSALTAYGVLAVGAPVAMVYSFPTSNSEARNLSDSAYYSARRERKDREKMKQRADN